MFISIQVWFLHTNINLKKNHIWSDRSLPMYKVLLVITLLLYGLLSQVEYSLSFRFFTLTGLYFQLAQWWIQNFQEVSANSRGGHQHAVWPIFPKTAWKWSNFGQRRASFVSPRSATVVELSTETPVTDPIGREPKGYVLLDPKFCIYEIDHFRVVSKKKILLFPSICLTYSFFNISLFFLIQITCQHNFAWHIIS